MALEIKISKELVSYKKAINLLTKRVDLLKKSKGKELIWILEHPLTFTAGIRSKDEEVLDKKIKIIKTNRGGKITLHKDRKSTRLNSSHSQQSRMPSSA